MPASEEARRAIIAHELAHVAYYAKGNRLHLLGLWRFAGKGYRERFEKRADVEARRRGYAQGLKEYRIWLYEHVPPSALPEKRRNYLSPAEIDALERLYEKIVRRGVAEITRTGEDTTLSVGEYSTLRVGVR